MYVVAIGVRCIFITMLGILAFWCAALPVHRIVRLLFQYSIHFCGEHAPCLPKEPDGLRISLDCFGRCLTVAHHTDGKPGEVRSEAEGRRLDTQALESPYRSGGAFLAEEDIPSGELHIYVG